jgi:Na+/H+ antiporter NhaD/arsenite permease-like protein
LLLTRRVKSRRIYNDIDWSLLLMFAGLFIIVGAAQNALLTVLGSIANLIVVERAAILGVNISFWDYFRVGAPLTIITLVIGTLWLCL